ncbi:ABC transporter permease [Viridibacillus sp. NPDC093762]|uniref:ABC transporter permease n=1 Tax=Viridibacillus sp. NPDC093762 TaxID=3390720 RepID=UPI003D081FBD
MILTITNIYLKETFRNYGVLFGNLLPAILFLGMSILLKKVASIDSETLDFIIRGQFISMSILLTIFSLAFSGAIVYLTDKRTERAFEWIDKTNIKFFDFFAGLGLGMLIIMNVFLAVILLAFSTITTLELIDIGRIILISNFTLLALYPISYLLSSIFPNGKTATTMLVPLMLILLFSITMTDLFVTLSGNDPQDYYKFLIWNPMLFLNDTVQYILGLAESPWMDIQNYLAILVVLFILLFIISKKSFRYLK